MKSKWQFWTGWTFAAVVLAWCVLAYIFMWPPVVTDYYNHHASPSADVCRNNLRQLDAAIQQFALERDKHNGDPVTLQDLTPYIKLNSRGEIPECPAGGKYSVTVVGAPPTCSLATNSSAPKKVRVDYFYWKMDPGYGSHRLY
jgi:hypothetical protein